MGFAATAHWDNNLFTISKCVRISYEDQDFKFGTEKAK